MGVLMFLFQRLCTWIYLKRKSCTWVVGNYRIGGGCPAVPKTDFQKGVGSFSGSAFLIILFQYTNFHLWALLSTCCFISLVLVREGLEKGKLLYSRKGFKLIQRRTTDEHNNILSINTKSIQLIKGKLTPLNSFILLGSRSFLAKYNELRYNTGVLSPAFFDPSNYRARNFVQT